jgi:hypothetical protein
MPTRTSISTPNSRHHFAIRFDTIHHIQASQHGPLGILFMGDRRAEEGQDGVAHQPCYVPFISKNRSHHTIEHTVDDPGPFFGVELFASPRGADAIADHKVTMRRSPCID